MDKPTGEVHIRIEPLQKMYSDQTGKFPIRAASGNQYIMIAYHVDANTITTECFRNKTDAELIKAYDKIMAKYTGNGGKVALHVPDNEASKKYRAAITKNGVTYQLAPPLISTGAMQLNLPFKPSKST